MSTTRDYLKELSDLFVSDLHTSQYYRSLTAAERAEVDRRLADDAARGLLPLVPGALATDLAALEEALAARLGIWLPEAIKALLREVDGFVENGTVLYSVDAELTEGESGARPGILAENELAWRDFPELSNRWLLVGDNELSFFGYDLDHDEFWALERYSLRKQHEFVTGGELLCFLLRTALRLPEAAPDTGSATLPDRQNN